MTDLPNGPTALTVVARALCPLLLGGPTGVQVFDAISEDERTCGEDGGQKIQDGFAFGTSSCACRLGSPCSQQANPELAPNAGEQSTPLIRSVKGRDLFRAYRASCHGLDAKGTGPAASALKAKIPDLTLLSRKNQGQFPAARVREAILGDQVVVAHGSREMPIWGPIFHQVEADQDWGNVRLDNLVKYLESIQSISGSNSSSGAGFTNNIEPSAKE